MVLGVPSDADIFKLTASAQSIYREIDGRNNYYSPSELYLIFYIMYCKKDIVKFTTDSNLLHFLHNV